MKIACIDKSKTDQEALKCILENAYHACLSEISYITPTSFYISSVEQALLESEVGVVAIGPGFSTSESYLISKRFKEKRADVQIVIFLDSDTYKISELKRFEDVADKVFKSTEDPHSIVHYLSSFNKIRHSYETGSGKVIAAIGAKGGVGLTSIVSGLAHASQACQMSALIIDLSATSSFCHYMGVKRWHSPEYNSSILNEHSLKFNDLDECIIEAENGIHLLLPPAESTQSNILCSEIRDQWLRDKNCLELTFHLIELLKTKYDVVLIDTARVESLLTYSLIAKSDVNLLITSNTASSIYMLRKEYEIIKESTFKGTTHILFNEVDQSGQNKECLEDYLKIHNLHCERDLLLKSVPYEKSAKSWIGTGNTFYTEASARTKKILEKNLNLLLLSNIELEKQINTPYINQWNFLKFITPSDKQNKVLEYIEYHEDTVNNQNLDLDEFVFSKPSKITLTNNTKGETNEETQR